MGVDSPGAAQRNIADDMHMDDDSPNKALHKKSRTQPATPTSDMDTYADDSMSPHTGALASAEAAEIAGTNMGQHTHPATGQPAQPELHRTEGDDDGSDSDGDEVTEDPMSPAHVPASPIGKWLKGPPPQSPSPRPGQKRTSARRRPPD